MVDYRDRLQKVVSLRAHEVLAMDESVGRELTNLESKDTVMVR